MSSIQRMRGDHLKPAITDTQADIIISTFRETGALASACKLAGTTKHVLQKYLESQQPSAEVLKLNIDEATELWCDRIRQEVTRRAIDGVEKDVWFKGQVVGTEVVYSDALLARLADATVPEFKKQAEHKDLSIQVQINTFQQDQPQVIIDTTTATISDLE